jgi:glutathione S-transferase
MARPIVYGPAYSTYVRTTRLALEEKGVPYDLVEIDSLAGGTKSPEHLARHPFGKVPAFEHDGLGLFETDAITRYVNEAFEGPALEPGDLRARARMTEAISVINSYAYPSLIGQIVIQRLVMPLMGGSADEGVIAAAMPQARTCIAVLDRMTAGHRRLVSDVVSRADLFLIPIYHYLEQTPEGQELLAEAGLLRRWWEGVADRPSVVATRPKLG